MQDGKGTIITNAFQKFLDEFKSKPNMIWVHKSSKFYNRLMKFWLEKNAIEMYSTHNEVKSVDTERFMRTLKELNLEIHNFILKKRCIDKLDDIVNKYKHNSNETC